MRGKLILFQTLNNTFVINGAVVAVSRFHCSVGVSREGIYDTTLPFPQSCLSYRPAWAAHEPTSLMYSMAFEHHFLGLWGTDLG